jgi:hypothetical protein
VDLVGLEEEKEEKEVEGKRRAHRRRTELRIHERHVNISNGNEASEIALGDEDNGLDLNRRWHRISRDG